MKPFISVVLSFVLILSAPGPGTYQAFAQAVGQGKAVRVFIPRGFAVFSGATSASGGSFGTLPSVSDNERLPFNNLVSDTKLLPPVFSPLTEGRTASQTVPDEFLIPSKDIFKSRDPQAPRVWAENSFDYFVYGISRKSSASEAVVPVRALEGGVSSRAPPKPDAPPAQDYGVRHRNLVYSVSSIEALPSSKPSAKKPALAAILSAALFFKASILHAAGSASFLASSGASAAFYSAAPWVLGVGALVALSVYVLRQKELPQSLRGLILGHRVFITFGIYLHSFSQSFLVQSLTNGNMELVGWLRGLHYAAYALFSFLPIGPAVKRTDYKVLFIGTSLARALLMGMIPWSWMAGSLSFPLLSRIVAVNPLPQNMMTTSDSAAARSVLSGADDKLKKETAVLRTKVDNIGKIVIQFLAGWIVSALVNIYGNPGGYAMAYSGYSAMLLLSIPVFFLMFQDPRHEDPKTEPKPSRNWLNLFYPLFQPVWAGFKKLASIFGPRQVALSASKPLIQENLTLREKLAGFFEKFETLEGLGVILRDKVLLIMVAVSVIPILFADALGSVLLPAYVAKVIVPRLDLAHMPLVGSLLGTSPGIFTLMMTAGALGGYFGSKWLEGDKGSRRIQDLGHSRLYKAAAFGSLLFVSLAAPLLWMPSAEIQSLLQHGGKELILQALNGIPLGSFWAGLGIVLLAQFLKEVLHTLLKVAMEPVLLNHIPKGKEGTFYAALQMLQVALMGIGSLTIGIVIGKLSVAAGLVFISSFFAVHALVQWGASGRLGRENPKGWESGKP